MPADELATRLTGGVTVAGAPGRHPDGDRPGAARRPTSCSPPLPNQLFTRDTSAWLYGGVSLNPMFWPARQLETLNVEAIYRFHPRFRDAEFEIWFGGADHDWGMARIEGGDMMPVGDGVVLVGHGRAQHRPRRQHPRAEHVRRRRGAPRDRRADAARAGGDAPRHGLHVLRPRRRHALRAGRLADPADPLHAGRRRRASQAEVSERSFLDEVQDALGLERADARHDRRRRVRGRAQPVGRRQQRRRARARRRRRLRAQRGDQREAREGRHRGARDRGPGARPRPRRRPLHDLSRSSATPEEETHP